MQVKTGVTRVVFLIGDYAIKIPKCMIWNHFLKGLLANMEENLIWNIACIPDSIFADTKEHLCPVTWCSWGGWILIMKRAEPVNINEWKKIEVLTKICGDHKPANYGMLNGKMVMYDYGCK